jgi:hypothetical protein
MDATTRDRIKQELADLRKEIVFIRNLTHGIHYKESPEGVALARLRLIAIRSRAMKALIWPRM